VVNRGAAYCNGMIYYNTLDLHTVSIDAATGKEVWNTTLGDINKGESMTRAPIVARAVVTAAASLEFNSSPLLFTASKPV
jgi:outer membrane protein assembly factor BamB